jgi:hypothetical protein
MVLQANVKDYPWIETFSVAFQLICGTVIPFTIIAFCNVWIIVTLHAASKMREGMGVDSKNLASQVCQVPGYSGYSYHMRPIDGVKIAHDSRLLFIVWISEEISTTAWLSKNIGYIKLPIIYTFKRDSNSSCIISEICHSACIT